MNETTKHISAIVGAAVTFSGTAVAWMDAIDAVVRIAAGVMAIIAGFYTAKYYRKKAMKKYLELNPPPENDSTL